MPRTPRANALSLALLSLTGLLSASSPAFAGSNDGEALKAKVAIDRSLSGRLQLSITCSNFGSASPSTLTNLTGALSNDQEIEWKGIRKNASAATATSCSVKAWFSPTAPSATAALVTVTASIDGTNLPLTRTDRSISTGSTTIPTAVYESTALPFTKSTEIDFEVDPLSLALVSGTGSSGSGSSGRGSSGSGSSGGGANTPTTTTARTTSTSSTANGWTLTMQSPIPDPAATSPVDFTVTMRNPNPPATADSIYIESGWYWFDTPQLLSCTSAVATCSALVQARDTAAGGVANAIIIQAITVPQHAAGTPVEVTLAFRAPAGSDPRCAFYSAAYRDTAVDPVIVAPPAVRDFGCH